MESWWQGISVLNKGFVLSALAFTALFLWQIILIIFGMDAGGHDHAGGGGGGHGGLDHDADSGGAHGNGHGAEAVTFTLVSVRSLTAFGMLFSWAGALYLAGGTSILLALIYSAVWGFAAMFAVSGVLYWLLRQQERGNASIWSAIGEEGSVYMNIPERGVGKVRVMVSGAISFVNARSHDGNPLAAGAKVRVVGIVNDTMVEVQEMPHQEEM